MAQSPYYASSFHQTSGSLSSNASYAGQLQSPISLPTDFEIDQSLGYTLHDDQSAYGASPAVPPSASVSLTKSSKRKRPASSTHREKGVDSVRDKPSASSGPSIYERKKVSRACDSCKARKSRCSGTQPCDRCHGLSLPCEYNAEHRRGKPSSPQRAYSIADQDPASPTVANEQILLDTLPSHHQHEKHESKRSVPTALLDHRKSTRSSVEPDETSFEGHYIGPTSGIAFLYRAQSRFRQDFETSKSRSVKGKGQSQSSIFTYGDNNAPDIPMSKFVFPTREHAKNLVERYFDFAVPTYRFLHRPTVEGWLERLCDENEGHAQDRNALSNGKAAVVLMVLGTASLYKQDDMGRLRDGDVNNYDTRLFFEEAELKLSKETGPVRLESIQARLTQCLYLLGSSRINQAWYIFGTTTQLILALGLHRKRYSQSFGTTSGLIELECRRRVFWSAYTLDRYLSIILGRPQAFRDEDIDQHLMQRLNDNDLTFASANPRSSLNQCVSDAPYFHAKLAKILGGISHDLYPTSRASDTNWVESARKRTAELKEWRESLPAFLDPAKVDPSILIPIFQRQSTVLSLAYAHALLLANRQSLLSSFADLNRPQQDLPDGESISSLKECIDAAFLIVDTVNGFMETGVMYRTFWFTHYISFCAIATLYVYAIQQSASTPSGESALDGPNRSTPLTNSHFEAAEKCQRSIAETTANSSPFRRYNIILDELKQDVLYRLGRQSTKVPVALRVSTTVPIAGDKQRTKPMVSFYDGNRASDSSEQLSSNNDTDGAVVAHDQLSDLEQANAFIVDPLLDYKLTGDFSAPLLDGFTPDLDLFGPQGELVGWSEFDSWAIGWPDNYEHFDMEGMT